jgi:transcriptional regulator with XRE-family HTH domain
MSAADVSRYKQHKQRPRIDQVERLAAALEVDVLEVLIGLGAIDPSAKTTPEVKKSKRSASASW